MSDATDFSLFVDYVRAYGECRANTNLDPFHGRKDRPWWPMRYFMDDWILAAWVYRIRNRERCEVGLFLAEDHHKYVKDSGVKGGLIFLLTQTFHLLGKMEVFFVGPKPGREPTLDTGFEPEIPKSIKRVAEAHDMSLRHHSKITDEEGRLLYSRLTGFSHETIAEFERRGIDLTGACFVVQRDIWSFDHIEYLLRNAHAPERLFNGGARPIHRLSFQHDLLVLRAAVMEERFRTVLERFSGVEGATVQAEWESAVRVRYVSNADLSIPVLDAPPLAVRAGAAFEATLAPRSAQGYAAFQTRDLARRDEARPQLLAVTKDFEWSGISAKARANAQVVPLFDTLAELDLEIERRLSQAVTTRGELSERHD